MTLIWYCTLVLREAKITFKNIVNTHNLCTTKFRQQYNILWINEFYHITMNIFWGLIIKMKWKNIIFSRSLLAIRAVKKSLYWWKVHIHSLHWSKILGRKCPLFGFLRNPTNFWSLSPNPKSVFGCVVWILHCCQFCVF